MTAAAFSEEADLEILGRNVALARLDAADRKQVFRHLDRLAFASGTTLVREEEPGDDMFFVLEGATAISRRGLELRALGPAAHFGELALLGLSPRAATVVATEPVRLARLSRDRYRALAEASPHAALSLVEALLASLATSLVSMTDSVGTLLGDRLLPRRAEVAVTMGAQTRLVPTGTRCEALLPDEVNGEPVIACLLGARPVSLRTRVVANAALTPLSLSSPDGREVFRHSAGLLLLEAAHRAFPAAKARLGPALDTAQLLEIEGAGEPPLVTAARLGSALTQLVQQRVEFREERWTVEEARAELAEQGWDDAAALLDTWREASVELVSCGRVYALRTLPVVAHAGVLAGVSVGVLDGKALVLELGPGGERQLPRPANAPPELEVEARTPRWGGEMVEAMRPWREALGATSVGAFNRSCVSGHVAELIRVAEGFHEKSLGRIADRIAARRDQLRVICIAGPSSSGKTTFIKRLITQLEVAGLRAHAVSLDDYYVDRDRTPRDEHGELDFESLDALDGARLAGDLAALLAGERVRPPRYDFKAGKSLPHAGAELELRAGEVLLLEGIHGLNPALFGGAVPAERVFRIFIHPASGLPLDRLSRVSPYDLRLLRRIVRDRHGRNTSAGDNILRWPSVRRGEAMHIYPFLPHADAVFDSSLLYEPAVIKVFAERYLLEVPADHPAHATAQRLRQLVDRFVAIYPDHVPPTSILREFIGGSGFEY